MDEVLVEVAVVASELVLRQPVARFGQLSGLSRGPLDTGRHRRMVSAGSPCQVAIEEFAQVLPLHRNDHVVAALAKHPHHFPVIPEQRRSAEAAPRDLVRGNRPAGIRPRKAMGSV